jgi:hypothetical protein
MKGKMVYFLLIFITVSAELIYPDTTKNNDKTKVLVLGTIHGVHYRNPKYNFDHIAQILQTYNPDVICVEIRPVDFRKVLYLTEMVTATIYGVKNYKKVYPIDWWSVDTRADRDAYMKTDEYKKKEKIEIAKETENVIIQDFNKKYGEWKNYSSVKGYEFWNSEEYNKYWEEAYRISMEVYGDGPMNLFYKTRNDKMLELIKNAIHENPGKKIIVLTGSEHKHYFDIILAKEDDVTLVKFDEILPLKSYIPDEDITLFIKENRANYYYDTSTQEGRDNYFHGCLMELVHGMDMDYKPEIIPSKNIPKAKVIIDEWEKTDPASIGLAFELGWYYFLTENYEKAIANFENTLKNIDKFYVKNLYLNVYRSLGFCNDMLGNREKAIEWYIRGEKFADENGTSKSFKDLMFKNYKEVPYKKK